MQSPITDYRHLVSKEVMRWWGKLPTPAPCGLLCFPFVPLGFCPLCVCVCVCVRAEFLSCVPLCHPIDCGPPGSYVHGISQARILEWAAISFSRGSSRPGLTLTSPASPSLTGRFFIPELPGKHLMSSSCAFLNSRLSSTQALTALYYLTGSPSSLLFGLDFLWFYL